MNKDFKTLLEEAITRRKEEKAKRPSVSKEDMDRRYWASIFAQNAIAGSFGTKK